MARRRKVHKKRTISPEQIQKMQAGRKRAQVHKDRVSSVSELEERLKKARNHSAVMMVALFTMFVLIGFLNSLDNRCVWALMGWTAMLPDKKQQEMYII